MKNRDKKKILTKIFFKIISLIMLLLITYNLVYFVSDVFSIKLRFLGINFFVVDNNLMKPELNQKDLIVTQKVKVKDLKQEDIIVYLKDEEYRIRRIVNIRDNKDKMSFAVKGDNTYYA